MQTEIQSALWSRASVTLFTAAAITKDSCQSFLICSDTKDKDKDTIAAFIFALYENHLFPSDQVDEEIIWSDGPTSEFKNKFTMKLLHQLSSQFQKQFSWKFSATSHGKGVVDGIGGRAKSLVRQKVMSQSSEPTIVQSAKGFSQTARILMPKTTVLYIPESEIHREKETRKLWKENLPAIPGITKMHAATHDPKISSLQLRKSALSAETIDISYRMQADEVPASDEEEINISVGDWVLVTYDCDGQSYPGEVTYTDPKQLRVNVMQKSVSHYKWPRTKDNIFYRYENVVQGPVVRKAFKSLSTV